jgi:hypothetical protein
MSRRDAKNLKTAGEILDLLQKAEQLSRTLDRPNSTDHTIGSYCLGQAIERYDSFRTTLHVAVHNILPEPK